MQNTKMPSNIICENSSSSKGDGSYDLFIPLKCISKTIIILFDTFGQVEYRGRSCMQNGGGGVGIPV